MFSATLALAGPAADLRPGLTGRVTISGAPQVGVLHVPRGAVFERDGGTVVFVRGGSVNGFTPTPVKVLGKTESSAVVEGVARGDRDRARRSVAAWRGVRQHAGAHRSGHAGGRARRPPVISRDLLPTLAMGVDNLFAHKLRSLLTMLGMIFGVAAVVAMLSIGAGAQQQVMAVIEAMGVRNLIVESKPAPDQQAFQRLRQVSPGLTLADMRVIKSTVDGVGASTARKRFTPSKLIPKPFADSPTVFGVEPTFQGIAGLRDRRGTLHHRRGRRGWPRRSRCSAKARASRSSAAGRRSASTSRSTSSGCASSASAAR